ncbi:hypothetical protein EQU24_11405 [Methylotuvimicrobium buryatense]|uniref:Uncharacterized protein n=2 Tax=Methylotuvimicrobium buryatense TaxID=95641 RepID=A0A4P9UNA0_METBY|nr:hypothetical protein EQU24_11405 [Methylotuvimicrobium buryatense]
MFQQFKFFERGFQMNPENQSTKEIKPTPPVDKKRRSFTKAGMTTPVIMSYMSRPAWAQTIGDNCSFTQALSGNTSPNGSTSCGPNRLSSRSPGFYQGQPVSRWEAVYGVTDASFNSIFYPWRAKIVTINNKKKKKSENSSSANDNPTLKDLLDAAHDDVVFEQGTLNEENEKVYIEIDIENPKRAKVLHYIAAYLNAISPVLIFPYTVEQIVNDWGQWLLFSNLQLIQDKDLTVAEVADILGIQL